MLARYRMFAGYNAWCNERLYKFHSCKGARPNSPNCFGKDLLLAHRDTVHCTARLPDSYTCRSYTRVPTDTGSAMSKGPRPDRTDTAHCNRIPPDTDTSRACIRDPTDNRSVGHSRCRSRRGCRSKM